MGQRKEIKNDGQFDAFVSEIIRDINSVIERIKECEFVPEGMDEVFEELIGARLSAECLFSIDKQLEMYGDNSEDYNF